MVYLPHLDYDLQRFGASGKSVPRRLSEIDEISSRAALKPCFWMFQATFRTSVLAASISAAEKKMLEELERAFD